MQKGEFVKRALKFTPVANRDTVRRHLVSVSDSVLDALSAINALSGDSMTLFVCGEDGKVQGTVTDGDIRRALLAGASLSSKVTMAMHCNFLAVSAAFPPYETVAEARKRGIVMLPELSEGYIVKLLDLREIHTSLPLDAVLMAGGRGERLRPLTLDTPKPLLKVGGKAIIDYNVEELKACGVTNIFVTVNYLKQQIIDHFKADGDVACVEEPYRLGTMGSLTLVDNLRHDNLILMNSDLLTSLDFEKMYLRHLASGAELTVAAVPYAVSVPFAIMHTEGDRVVSLSEKPTYNYFANAGVYILRRRLISEMPVGEYLDAPDFMQSLIDQGRKVSFYPVDGTWIDIGSPSDFRYADELMCHRGRMRH